MLIRPPTYGMRCRVCKEIVPVGTIIGIDENGHDYVEHPKCTAKRIVEKVMNAAKNAKMDNGRRGS
jgi:hypothetical protein